MWVCWEVLGVFMAWGFLIFQRTARVTRKTVVDTFTIHTLSNLFIFSKRADHGEAETYLAPANSALSGSCACSRGSLLLCIIV